MLPAFGLYSHIRNNRIRSGLLLAGLFLLVYVLTYAGALIAEAMTRDDTLDGYLRGAFGGLLTAFPWVTLGTGLWLAVAWKFHQGMIALLTGSHRVTREEEPKLYNLLENLCISRGLPMPHLSVMESEALNAFATGLNEEQYAVTVTRGLMGALTDAEMEAVLAHELTHIRNGDVRLMVIAVVIAGVVSFFGELMFRGLTRMSWRGSWRGESSRPSSSSSSGGRKGGGGAAAIAILIAVVLILLSWFLSILIRFALSRSREYLADAGAVELTKNPDAMIGALLKISGRGELANVPSGLMEMCVDNPRSGFADLFATHPSIEDRIDALVRFAGGRRPEPAETVPHITGRPDADPSPSGTAPPHGPWG
ncbi:peptidase M48 Ste24p [Chelatococcus daeguensis]|uniref:Peptidase M48 Ste24p n=1 Tax=Chelatococcus daeguensis TaxID=444444 RepID=A0AAC9NXC0_9HYPH|nr:peptidase M48 Ste24p [Chelatococcus daeguensis]